MKSTTILWMILLGLASSPAFALAPQILLDPPTSFGFPSEAAGGAAVTIMGNIMEVGGIGGSGADGIQFTMGGVQGASVEVGAFPANAGSGAERITEWVLTDGNVHRFNETRTPVGVVASGRLRGRRTDSTNDLPPPAG